MLATLTWMFPQESRQALDDADAVQILKTDRNRLTKREADATYGLSIHHAFTAPHATKRPRPGGTYVRRVPPVQDHADVQVTLAEAEAVLGGAEELQASGRTVEHLAWREPDRAQQHFGLDTSFCFCF